MTIIQTRNPQVALEEIRDHPSGPEWVRNGVDMIFDGDIILVGYEYKPAVQTGEPR